MCQRCGKELGVIVHHKEHLTPSNINDPSVSLSFDNLELVCRDCHADVHPEIYEREAPVQRVAFDAYGNVMRLEDLDGD